MFHPYSFYLQKHKNAKSNESLPSHFSASPYYSTSLSMPRYPQTAFGMSHFAFWDVPFCHLGYPISPFGISHFPFWGIPFHHLGCPISPFGVSHFTIWGIPFYLLGCPILPFGVYFRHICAQCTARFSVCHLRFRCKIYAFSLSIGKIDLVPFCIFVFLRFCILQMRNCFRSAIETSFIALAYSHF